MRILAIQPFQDSTLAVINDGEVELFLKEERYTRKKRDSWALKSIFLAAEHLRKNNKKVDYCCIAAPIDSQYCGFLKMHLERVFECEYYHHEPTHHLCHASLAFYNSGFDQSLVLVIDRNGSTLDGIMREVESMYLASYPCGFQPLYKNHSLIERGEEQDAKLMQQMQDVGYKFSADSLMGIVKVYESATTLIGENPRENGKTMGLAAYGHDRESEDLFHRGQPRDELFLQRRFGKASFPVVIHRDHLSKMINFVDEQDYQFYADYAYQVQKQTQAAALDIIEKWVSKTGVRRVCVTGGYGLNVVANEHFIKNLPDVEFYFEPLADDSGNSIGAAMHLYRELTKDMEIRKLSHTFFHGLGTEYSVPNGVGCTARDIAVLLAEQKSVAVYNALAEAGPRALGNRSILFDARNPDAKKIINRTKQREWYRPFAAMVLEKDVERYFHTHGIQSSPFMTVSFQVKDGVNIPGAQHVDGSSRIQTVSEDQGHIYDLLVEFKDITGDSVLLNTSFNRAGEALVETVADAVRTFNETDIDVLWFPEKNVMLRKTN